MFTSEGIFFMNFVLYYQYGVLQFLYVKLLNLKQFVIIQFK